MKASVVYDKKEVCAMVLTTHLTRFPAPEGMRWMSRMDYTDSVTCELESVAAEESAAEETP